jgi:signal transduction histidine kinase
VEGKDDGLGFDPLLVDSRPSAALHVGLDTIHERIHAAGGTVDKG